MFPRVKRYWHFCQSYRLIIGQSTGTGGCNRLSRSSGEASQVGGRKVIIREISTRLPRSGTRGHPPASPAKAGTRGNCPHVPSVKAQRSSGECPGTGPFGRPTPASAEAGKSRFLSGKSALVRFRAGHGDILRHPRLKPGHAETAPMSLRYSRVFSLLPNSVKPFSWHGNCNFINCITRILKELDLWIGSISFLRTASF